MYRDTNSDGDFADGGDVNVYYIQDRLFNVVALTDTDGSLVERTWYEPYGKPTNRRELDGDETTASHFGNPLLFTGHQFDGSTGNYYCRNRFYSPVLGIWASREDVPRLHSHYTYAAANPVTLVDPDGSVEVVIEHEGQYYWAEPAEDYVARQRAMMERHRVDAITGAAPWIVSAEGSQYHVLRSATSKEYCEQQKSRTEARIVPIGQFRVQKLDQETLNVASLLAISLGVPVVAENARIATDATGNIVGASADVAVVASIKYPTGNPDYPTVGIMSLGPKLPHRGKVALEFAYCVPQRCTCDEKTGKWALTEDESKARLVPYRALLSDFSIGVWKRGNAKLRPDASIGEAQMRFTYDADCVRKGVVFEKLILSSPPIVRGRDIAPEVNRAK